MCTGGEGVSGVSEAAEIEEPEVEETEEESSDEAEGNSEPETARETVARELKKLQEEDSGDGAAAPQKKESKSNRRNKKGAPQEDDAPIAPPNRLNAAQKELFNKLPPELKKATHAMIMSHESAFTRAQTEARAAQKEAAHIVEAVRPYLLSHPELQEQGYTESRIVSGLLAAHQRLTNPRTAVQAFSELGAQLGFSAEKIQAILGDGKQASAGDISRHPDFVALRNEHMALKSKIEGAEGQQFNRTVNSIVAEMEAVRDEQDASGRYVYPRLHDPDFLEQAKPLISALARSVPYGEAVRRAYRALEGQNGTPPQQDQVRLPQGRTERSSAAMASVRGRSAPVASPGELDEIPPEALGSARDSVAWALKQLRRG